MKKLLRLGLLATLCFPTACISIRPETVAPDFTQHALRTHRTVAVLPFYVEYPETAPPKGISMEEHLRARAADRREDSYALQDELVGMLQQHRRRLSFRVQDTAETNHRLRAAGLSWDSVFTQPRPALNRLLRTDATITPYAGAQQFGPAGGFVWALGVTTGAWIATKDVATGFIFHDATTGELAVRCHCKLNGTVGTAPGALAAKCFKWLVRGLPYRAHQLRRELARAPAAPPATP